MLTYIISYGVHLLAAVLFFLLLPLPMLIRGTEPEGPEKVAKLLSIYKIIIFLAHGALIIALITGLLMNFNLLSFWMVGVILVWVGIGAYLGLTAKYIRITLEAIANKVSYEESLQKVKTFSFFLMLGVVAMFMLKYIPIFIG
ncbi:hypothetical protein [Bacillus alkalicellulosilyticus]|uniref:hypothetical protein n=1 Tax=Alkalihalobacterium alkalicellulosilyticum TaxID=1912214 RepID=UPI000996AB53|nr:hypothetical protein [Bacillus alkalicellulosilyticus]